MQRRGFQTTACTHLNGKVRAVECLTFPNTSLLRATLSKWSIINYRKNVEANLR